MKTVVISSLFSIRSDTGIIILNKLIRVDVGACEEEIFLANILIAVYSSRKL